MKITKNDESGDVVFEFQQDGTTSYVMGIDDTDNLFKIHKGTALANTSHFTINASGKITTGTWKASAIVADKIDSIEGTAIKSTGESGGSKFLREDGDESCSWQSPSVSINTLSDALVENNSIWLGNDPSSSTSTAQFNVAVGVQALDAITTGDNNIALGYNAGTAFTDGDDSIFIGYNAGDAAGSGSNTDINEAVIIGSNAGSNTLEGDSSGDCDGTIAIGYNAANALRYAKHNTIIGYDSYKLGVGSSSNEHLGGYNTTIGYATLDAETGNSLGYKNTAIGSGALTAVDEVRDNTAIGYNAGVVMTGSDFTVLVGAKAGEQLTDCQRTVCIGYDSGQLLETAHDCTFIGANTVANSGGGGFYTAAAGTFQLVIGGGVEGQGQQTSFIGSSGTIFRASGGGTAWNQTSDGRLKKNIEDCDVGLEELEKIKIIKYQFKNKEETPKYFGYDSDKIRYGVIAQDCEDILEGFITKNADGWYSTHNDPLIWCTVNSIQQLSSKYESSQEMLDKQNEEIKTLKENISKMEQNLENILKNI